MQKITQSFLVSFLTIFSLFASAANAISSPCDRALADGPINTQTTDHDTSIVKSLPGQESQDFGLIGVGVMGMGFAENAAEKGIKMAVTDLPAVYPDKLKHINYLRAKGQDILIAKNNLEFLLSLKKPRTVMILAPTHLIEGIALNLLGLLEPGDTVIDSANSHFTQTERLQKVFADQKINYIGMGISGGARGARLGPSMMLGGDKAAVDRVLPILEKIAGKADSDGIPAVAYMGPGAAGHIVKTVHNGIEYAEIQLIGELYEILFKMYKGDVKKILEPFKLIQGTHPSYLVDATIRILSTSAPQDATKNIVEFIFDSSGKNGTGQWTQELAAALGVYSPMISASFQARQVSAMKKIREFALETYQSSDVYLHSPKTDRDQSGDIGCLAVAFIGARRLAFMEGFEILHALSKARSKILEQFMIFPSTEEKFNFELEKIAQTWRQGCILQGSETEYFKLFKTNPKKAPSEIEKFWLDLFKKTQELLPAQFIALENRVSAPALNAAHQSLYAWTTSTSLSAQITQALRNFFGMHPFYWMTDPNGAKQNFPWKKD